MTTNRTQLATNMSNRQKIITVAVVIVVAILIWQVIGLFRGGSQTSMPVPHAPAGAPAAGAGPNAIAPPPQNIPQQAQLLQQQQQQPLSQREAELVKLQQETQAKYLSALNELQMLKVEKDIAETNKAIMAARLDTITAQKNIIDLLKPAETATASSYAPGLVNPVAAGASQTTTVTPTASQDVYIVLSVTKLQNRWSAVLGYQGKLFSVFEGDVLPIDGSKILTIDRSGVLLELKDGTRKKVSMVPII